MIDRFCLSLNL